MKAKFAIGEIPTDVPDDLVIDQLPDADVNLLKKVNDPDDQAIIFMTGETEKGDLPIQVTIDFESVNRQVFIEESPVVWQTGYVTGTVWAMNVIFDTAELMTFLEEHDLLAVREL